MTSSRAIPWAVGIWIFVLALYAGISLTHPRGSQSLVVFGNMVQCIVPLIANAGLLLNAGTPYWRRNIFWMLLALSCTLWMIGEFQWTYYEVYLHRPFPGLYPGDILFFLRGIPFMAALTLAPHRKRGEVHARLGYLDFSLLLTWWTFIYGFFVLPWIYATPALEQYNHNFNLITDIQNGIIVLGLISLWVRSHNVWKKVYFHLLGASVVYMLASLVVNVQSDVGAYYTGSLYDLPLISCFLWFALAGLIAYSNRDRMDAAQPEESYDSGDDSALNVHRWSSRLAMVAVISLPLLALYSLHADRMESSIRDFRLVTTMVAALPLAGLIFVRNHFAEADRARLLVQSEQALENLKRLQAQLVQTEKLVSLGQLAAGAAHEINNPLAAILGFSDLLADDESLPDKARSTASKIRQQARRTKALVGNLLSFARQVPPERTLLDINTVLNNAVQLRTLDLRSSATRIEQQLESVLPGVRGDGNQLMQVFFNLISNAVDAMESHKGGVLTIKTMRDRGNVVILFSDTGPGIKEPHRVFDPFYTTKPVGKGTGLGLSICFGIVQEHNGRILCYNRQEGGAVFRVELPAILAAFPAKELQQLAAQGANPRKPN
ncbi:MAG TPA: HAMP domain-containing sensor histidine kinase [Candidatus Dormibacteraeota bacterium]|nr:HAMP domain-containing sensor histidine kinase [Candidatus Dormibacteraeota bacterium]